MDGVEDSFILTPVLLGWIVAFYLAFGPHSVVGTLCKRSCPKRASNPLPTNSAYSVPLLYRLRHLLGGLALLQLS